MQHSSIVGGSTAKRVMNCPGSVALVAKMPAKPSSSYADEGTMLHTVIAEVLNGNIDIQSSVDDAFDNVILTQELVDDKLLPALAALDTVDPYKTMEYAVETKVGFGDFLPGVFGSTDLLGRIGTRAFVIDWKFGDGVYVEAEDNPQLMFYAAAAMRTDSVKWVFDGITDIELVIIQPAFGVSSWVTTPGRIKAFERDLVRAVKRSEDPDAELQDGDHCRWCAARAICPILTGAVDRIERQKLENIDAAKIGEYLTKADLLEDWIKDLRGVAQQLMEKGITVDGWKMVSKRATRKWVDEDNAELVLSEFLPVNELYETSMRSPAAVEKLLKQQKIPLPKDLYASISSGSTIAPLSDPRPAVLQIGQQLKTALAKLS